MVPLVQQMLLKRRRWREARMLSVSLSQQALQISAKQRHEVGESLAGCLWCFLAQSPCSLSSAKWWNGVNMSRKEEESFMQKRGEMQRQRASSDMPHSTYLARTPAAWPPAAALVRWASHGACVEVRSERRAEWQCTLNSAGDTNGGRMKIKIGREKSDDGNSFQ